MVSPAGSLRDPGSLPLLPSTRSAGSSCSAGRLTSGAGVPVWGAGVDSGAVSPPPHPVIQRSTPSRATLPAKGKRLQRCGPEMGFASADVLRWVPSGWWVKWLLSIGEQLRAGKRFKAQPGSGLGALLGRGRSQQRTGTRGRQRRHRAASPVALQRRRWQQGCRWGQGGTAYSVSDR